MKVLFLHPALRTYRAPLFQQLAQDGIEFLFTSQNEKNSIYGKDTAQALERFPFHFTQAAEISWLPFRNFSWDLWRALGYQVVIFSGITSAPFLFLTPILKLLRRRIIVFDELWSYPIGSYRHRLVFGYVRRLLRGVDAVVAASSKSREMFHERLDVAPQRIFLACNTTVDLGYAALDAEKDRKIHHTISNLAGGRTVVLYLGRFMAIKGLDILIQAIDGIEDCCLIVVGDGEGERSYRDLAQELGLERQVFFLGPCEPEDAVYFYRASDIFVLPSRFLPGAAVDREAWGFTVNEAMSLAMPVIATDACASAHDLVRNGETGMLARAGDVEDLREKLVYLLFDRKRSLRIGAEGRRHLKATCNYDLSRRAFRHALKSVGDWPPS